MKRAYKLREIDNILEEYSSKKYKKFSNDSNKIKAAVVGLLLSRLL